MNAELFRVNKEMSRLKKQTIGDVKFDEKHYLQEAKVCQNSGKTNEAIGNYEKAIYKNKRNEETYYALIKILKNADRI